ncbi:pseudouridine synthase family protein [Candidatus Vidania fulgoroideorum]
MYKEIYKKKKITFLKKQNKIINPFYENYFFFLVEKPRKLLTYPTEKNNYSLINCINLNYNLNRFGLMNRLDKNSSGIIIFCKTLKSIRIFKKNQEKKKIKKYYLALTTGSFPIKKTIECFLKKKNSKIFFSYKRKEKFKYSRTNFFCIDRKKRCSIVLCKTKTGIFHQIRVQLKIAGFPLLNDKFYNKKTKRDDFFLFFYKFFFRKKKFLTDFRFFLNKFYFNMNFRRKIVLK